MAQDWTESTKETINYRRFTNQFPPNIIKLIRQLKRFTKTCTQKMSIMFNQICINKEMLHTHRHTHTHIYIYEGHAINEVDLA